MVVSKYNLNFELGKSILLTLIFINMHTHMYTCCRKYHNWGKPKQVPPSQVNSASASFGLSMVCVQGKIELVVNLAYKARAAPPHSGLVWSIVCSSLITTIYECNILPVQL